MDSDQVDALLIATEVIAHGYTADSWSARSMGEARELIAVWLPSLRPTDEVIHGSAVVVYRHEREHAEQTA